LAEGVARLGTELPFARAARLVGAFWQVELSEATVRRTTLAAGAAYVAVQTHAVEALEAAALGPGPRETASARTESARTASARTASAISPLQQLSVDGAMVPLVGGVWTEVKTLAIGEITGCPVGTEGVGTEGVGTQTERLSYFSRRADHITFARLAEVELDRRQTAEAGIVVAVLDGAEWLQGFVDYHRPDAVRVLDFSHAVEHLGQVAQAIHGSGTEAAMTWLEEQRTTLKQRGGAAVLEALDALPIGDARDPAEAARVRDGVRRYLEKRLDQLEYPTFLARGYPIGSGIVESANKLVVEARLKGSGMHWAGEHVNPMVALRTVVCAERWPEAWPAISHELREHARRHRRARREHRRAERLPAKTPAPLLEDSPTPGGASNPVPTQLLEATPTQATPTQATPTQATPPAAASRTSRQSTTTAPASPRRPAANHPWRRPFVQRQSPSTPKL
jgi:hypothetical protein